MKEHKGIAKGAFQQSVHNEPTKNKEIGRVSKMIQGDRPMLILRPPAAAYSIDAQSFNSRWLSDMREHHQKGVTPDKKSKDPVTKQFNQSSDPLDQITDKKRDRGRGR